MANHKILPILGISRKKKKEPSFFFYWILHII